jgi:hypothetical protein
VVSNSNRNNKVVGVIISLLVINHLKTLTNLITLETKEIGEANNKVDSETKVQDLAMVTE